MADSSDGRSQKERMLAGDLYVADDPELAADNRRISAWMDRYNASQTLGQPERQALLEEMFGSVGTGCNIRPPFHCDYGYNIHCGPRVYFNTNCVILDVCRVSIGGGTLFGPAVHIYTATHPLPAAARKTSESGKPVIIGSNCWIGGGAIILPGVSIGDNCVIGAGSVVNRDIPPNSLAAGNPAKVKRQLE